MNSGFRILILIIILSLHITIITESIYCEESRAENAITTPEEAIKCALVYTGFAEIIDTSKLIADEIASLVIINDDKTPFINKFINGKEVWQVEFKNIRLDIDGWMQSVIDNQIPNDFVVLLDPKTGQLFKISSTIDSNKIQIREKPIIDPKLGYIDSQGEIFKNFPERKPEYSFLDALKSSGISSPIMAKKLVGVLLISSEENSEKAVIWCISSYKIPAIELGGPHLKEGQRAPRRKEETMHSVVDAKTGEWLSASSKR
ncbi:MAG: hypothetical protein ABIJ12_06005 [bacterium]